MIKIRSILIVFVILVIASISYLKLQETSNFGILGQDMGAFDKYSPIKLEGWGSGWITAPEYDGKNMPDTAMVLAENIDMDIKDSIAPRMGTEILGTELTDVYPIYGMHTSKALDGRELLIKASTSTLSWYNADVLDWEMFSAGYTANQTFSFVDGATSTDTANYTYFSNGKDEIKRFRIAFGSVSSATASTTSLALNSVTGFDSLDDIGFSMSGTITASSTNYTYTAINGWTFTGMSAVPDLDTYEGVISSVESSVTTSGPTAATDLVIKDQRLYASFNNSVYCSKIDDFANFSFSSPRTASEGEIVIFPEGGDKITGLALRPSYVVIFKQDYIGSLEFKDFGENLSDIPVINTISLRPEVGATNPKSIAQSGYSVIYANSDIGPAELNRLESKDYDQADNLGELVRPSLESYDFTDSASIIYKTKSFTSGRDGGSVNNFILIYDNQYRRLTKFTNLNAKSFAVYNNELYYGDASSQNVYKMGVSTYDDNGNAYTTEWKTKWYNFGEPDRWKELGWVFVEGFIAKGTTLTFKINLDDGGNLSQKTVSITGSGDYVSASPSSGFGTNPFGVVNFSNVDGTATNLRKFQGYINTGDLFGKKFRNVQFAGSTSGQGQNYRIMKIVPYIYLLDPQYGREYSTYTIP